MDVIITPKEIKTIIKTLYKKKRNVEFRIKYWNQVLGRMRVKEGD